MIKHISVAIDGPSGAGKSTLAKSLAAELKFLYVDTGAIYRTIGYFAWKNHIDPKNATAVEFLNSFLLILQEFNHRRSDQVQDSSTPDTNRIWLP